MGSWFPPQMVGGLVALIESAGGAVTSIRGKQRGERWAPFLEVDLGRLIGSGRFRNPTILTVERKEGRVVIGYSFTFLPHTNCLFLAGLHSDKIYAY